MIVVADTSVILNLCCVQQAQLLPVLFHEVWVPDQVRIEFERLSLHQPRFHGLLLPDWILIQPAAPVSAELAAIPNLHAGETAALALAISGHADAVLMDESAGRRAAQLLGVPAIGVLGVLLQARKMGLLPAIKPVLDRLASEAGFWLSPSLTEAALKKCGET